MTAHNIIHCKWDICAVNTNHLDTDMVAVV